MNSRLAERESKMVLPGRECHQGLGIGVGNIRTRVALCFLLLDLGKFINLLPQIQCSIFQSGPQEIMEL